jgi:hypothetical protein
MPTWPYYFAAMEYRADNHEPQLDVLYAFFPIRRHGRW